MAKKVNRRADTPLTSQTSATGTISSAKTEPFFMRYRIQAVLLAIVSLVLYSNTLFHLNAFDDRMAIVDNRYVQQGVAGIGDIMTHDAYQSYLEGKGGGNQLAGGRYRPLSLITFAVEQEVMGVDKNAGDSTAVNDTKEQQIATQMPARHVVNVLLYAVLVMVVLYLLRYVLLPTQPLVAFAAAFLFAIHPLHTEVVANVKSRDEILSLLFICLTLIKAHEYNKGQQRKSLIQALVFYFLALLSKEYAVTLLVLLPAMFYTISRDAWAVSFKKALPYLAPFVLYMLLRLAAVSGPGEEAGASVMNNPYVLATPVQKLATEFLVLLKYVGLLFFPHPLVSDYSYNQIPYTTFADARVLVSILLYAAIAVGTVLLLQGRRVAGFALGFYLLQLLLVSNLFVNIGAPMGERLAFHSSLGFCVLIALLMGLALAQIKEAGARMIAFVAVLFPLLVMCGYAVMARNKDWKDDVTLFTADVQTSPNSVLINNNAAAAWMARAKVARTIDKQEAERMLTIAIGYYSQALRIYPQHTLARINRGLCYFNTGNPDRAVADWDTLKAQSPNQPELGKYMGIAGKYYYGQGMKYANAHKTDSAIAAFSKSVHVAPGSYEPWLQLANVYHMASMPADALNAAEHAKQLAPANPQVRAVYEQLKQGH